jgi:hypothetical protein
MITEAELTQDQIKQIFQSVTDGAAAGGNVQNAGDEPVSNRTLVGKGGDKVKAGYDAVSKAWEGVKTKISQSAPVAGFDQAVDAIQGKLLNAAGGESGAVGQALAKYREFAKAHPIMQGAIYAGLIALAGISGAGLGGAALLAGIKTFDRLLQGDKASSALWSGFKTGAIAYGAGQIGKALQGGEKVTSASTTDTGVVNMPGDPALTQAMANGQIAQNWIAQDPRYADTIKQMMSSGEKSAEWKSAFANYLSRNSGALNPATSDPGSISHAIQMATKLADTQSRLNSSYIPIGKMIQEYIDYEATMRMRLLAESRGMSQKGCYLTASGVKAIFEGVVAEGPWDAIKSGVSKVAGGVEKFGQGIANAAKKGWDSAANKITYDKLDLNWRKNYKEFDPTGGQGPVDSEQVKAFLRKQGVTDVLINKVFGDLGLDTPAPADQAQAPAGGFSTGAAFTDLFKKFSDGGGNLAPQVRGVLKDILLTAMRTVESMQRKRMYGAPVLSEVRTDFSAALLKSLK